MRRAYLWALAPVCTLALVAVACWPDGDMRSRDIGCARASGARAREICDAMAGALEWTWMGHAIVSPGWRLTWAGVRRVYCGARVGVGDTTALQALARGADWRLQTGADELLTLARASVGAVTVPENSILHPANPAYVLRGGCGAR